MLNDDVNQLERFLDKGPRRSSSRRSGTSCWWAACFCGDLGAADAARLPADPGDRRRVDPLPAPARAAVCEGAGRASADLSSTLSNNLGGITTIKAFTAEEREAERGPEEVSEEYGRRQPRRDPVLVGVHAADPNGDPAGFTLTLLIGGRLVLDGDLEVGIFSVLVYMTQRLLWPLTDLGETLDLYQRAMASTRRLFDLLDRRPVMVPGSEPLRRRWPATSAAHVRFAYGEGPATAARDGHPRVPPARPTRWWAPPAAGKSTLVKLLLRFYDPQRGPGADRRPGRARR